MKRPNSKWQTMMQLALITRCRKQVLFVGVDCATFLVTALESPMPAGGGKRAVQHVFDNHAHEVIGHARSLSDGIRRAERYAARWTRRRKKAARCACRKI